MSDIPSNSEKQPSSLSPNQDPSSIYYIHPSDTNINQIVTIKFNGIGYNDWKRSMLIMLSIKNKLRFVDDQFDIPATDSIEYNAWERCNNLVLSWLHDNLDNIIKKCIMYFSTTSEVWKDLEECFGQSSMTQVFSLEQQMADLSQGSMTVSV